MSEAERIWQVALAQAFRTPESLCAAVGIAPPKLGQGVDNFPLLVPRGFMERMRPGDSSDPLLRQVLINPREYGAEDIGVADPVGEHSLLTEAGLIQKYPGRALVIMTGSCAVHCRYCFRRQFPYADHGARIEDVVSVLAARADIHELILSGGDPLLLPNQVLSQWLEALHTIPHLRVVRIHSRIPVVLPERMTGGLLSLLAEFQKKIVLVVHANHPQELQGDCAMRLQHFVRHGITILNQSVLLAGVNDNEKTLADLSWRLIELGVQPYYLHQLDRVKGAMHFAVDDERAIELVELLRVTLPGYLVPKLVREVAGESSKAPVYPSR